MRPRHAPAGFSLLELLVVIVIVAIIAALALPSLTASVRSRHNTDLAIKLGQDLAWARGEAIAGWTVTMTLNQDGSWSVTDTAPNAATAEHSLSSAQLQADAPGASCSVGNCAGTATAACTTTPAMTFDSLGMITGAPAGVLSYSNGTTSATMQIFSSGVVVENPCNAS